MMASAPIWVVDDDRSIRWVLERALSRADLGVQTFDNASAALDALQESQPRVLLTDIRMPGLDGLSLLANVHDNHPGLPVIVMTAHSDMDSAVAAYEGGAFEYLPKPFDVDEAIGLVQRALAQEASETDKRQSENGFVGSGGLIGESPAMQEVFRAIGRLAQSSITVLINGASGTGKELVARALHQHSPRKNKPFIALNMAAIPKDLMDSELFGHARGAFTGANADRSGRFKQADGGTLFLDEIGDMPMETQTRLLRVLAEGEFYPVGAQASVKVDVRIIAATHQNLERLVEQGQFREDLFHRLNVIRVHIPELRERREDIPLLAQHFLRRAAEELGAERRVLLPEAEKFLSTLDWPGNVRQLENACRWLTVMAPSREVRVDDLPLEFRRATNELSGEDWERPLRRWVELHLQRGEDDLLQDLTPRFEKLLITTALRHTGGRKQDAAKRLGWGRNTLTRKIQDLKLDDTDL
ncbi:MAG: nitrogen regulation protein NR(I) [Gammaproteobacteria bacterium]